MTIHQFDVVVNEPMLLGECPLWHPQEKALYWIDIDGCAVHRFHPTKNAHEKWPTPSEPGCIAWCREGGLIVALRSGLMWLDTASGTLEFLAEPPYDPAVQRFNDGRCDSHGRLWVGSIHEPRDRPAATLYCIDHGRIQDQHKPLITSNGVAFSPDQGTLYHADTREHRIHAYAFDVVAGATGAARIVKQFSDDRSAGYGGRPDGAAVDSEGGYWIAMYEGGAVLRLSPTGEILARLAVPFRCPTMVCFGGEDLKTLYITSARHGRGEAELQSYPLSGYVVATRVEVAGLPEHGYVR